MVHQNIRYQEADGIARITINRPEVMNALSPATLVEMKAAVQKAGDSRDIGVIILTGEGRAFSAGVDLTSLGGKKLERGRIGPVLDVPALDLINAIQAVPKVVIAMVNGYCITGALEIALACDIIVASEEARFGDTHTRWGIRPSWGMSQRLPRLVGVHKAKELSFTAGLINGQEAERIGLVNVTVSPERLEDTVHELARKILANSRETIAAIKYLCNNGLKQTLEQGLELEASSEFDITDTEERLRDFLKKT